MWATTQESTEHCIDLHHKHASSVCSTGSYVWGTDWFCLSDSAWHSSHGILCDFAWSFLHFPSMSQGYTHFNWVDDFVIFVFPTYREVYGTM